MFLNSFNDFASHYSFDIVYRSGLFRFFDSFNINCIPIYDIWPVCARIGSFSFSWNWSHQGLVQEMLTTVTMHMNTRFQISKCFSKAEEEKIMKMKIVRAYILSVFTNTTRKKQVIDQEFVSQTNNIATD